jgi:predicted SAM-dependent methyltransferase
MKQWVRVLKPRGELEVWVPDGLKMCKVLLEAESGAARMSPDDWTVLNPRDDPFLWVNGRMFYGARQDYPSWHKAVLTPRYLKDLFERVGLVDVRELDRSEVRGHDHGWINLGVTGRKL